MRQPDAQPPFEIRAIETALQQFQKVIGLERFELGQLLRIAQKGSGVRIGEEMLVKLIGKGLRMFCKNRPQGADIGSVGLTETEKGLLLLALLFIYLIMVDRHGTS